MQSQVDLYKKDFMDASRLRYDHSAQIPPFLTPRRLLELEVKKNKLCLKKYQEVVQSVSKKDFEALLNDREFVKKLDNTSEAG